MDILLSLAADGSEDGYRSGRPFVAFLTGGFHGGAITSESQRRDLVRVEIKGPAQGERNVVGGTGKNRLGRGEFRLAQATSLVERRGLQAREPYTP